MQRSRLRGSVSCSESVQPCGACLTRLPYLPDESPGSTIPRALSQSSTSSILLREPRHNEQAASEPKRDLSYSTREVSLEHTSPNDHLAEFACEDQR